ncbi:Similar to V-type proton ATPase subunit C (Manduca sexta) [Cotesia congregata]|uniref:V-type proton ATPase subunit C n=1 Tax=Cotesia congregata TaxID=51543 RepID=A0A8J2H939_COTCN|nr:Similar to V-type proton ATPase subunit C (Manduca sexta) [Cotesia congregata]
MTEYWLISAPGDKTCQQTWETVNNLTSKQHSLSANYKFHIPDLKVGTLDQLVGLSDDLGKLDTFVEQVTRKVAVYLGEVLEDQRDKLHENLMANNSQTSMDEESPSPEVPTIGTPPNTPVTPMSKVRDHQNHNHHHHHHHHHHNHHTDSPKLWKETDSGPASLGQHHQHFHFSPTTTTTSSSFFCSSHDKKKSVSTSSSDNTNKSTSNESSSIYSCYQVHWCANSASSSPSPPLLPSTASPLSPTWSVSSVSDHEDAFVSSKKITDGKITGGKVTDRRSKKSFRRKSSKRKSAKAEDNHCAKEDQHLDDEVQENTADKEECDVDKEELDDDDDVDDDDDDFGGILYPGDLPTYITRFQWDMAKYPIKQSLRNIADIIGKQVGQIDADLKTKSTTYNNLKGSLQNLEKKQTGSLLTRNLADLVKKEHFILDSEYLSTLLVIVPKSSFHEWHAIYEKLTDMIVPRSTQLITQDAEYGLFTVTLFKKVIEEFKLHAREKKFIVRDFTYNEEELAAGKNEITKLVTDKKKQFGPLVRWLKVNFSECFCAWIHVKALRVFVESVLRYGLPVNFQAILLHPNKKTTKRLRDVLNQLYAHLDSSAASGGHSANQDSVDIPGLGFGQNEYYPYVYYKINIDMVDSKV